MVHSKKQEKKQKEENENDKWGHAIPLEDTRLWNDKEAEAEFMKDLLLNKLPCGKDTSEIESYFDTIKKCIESQAPISNDCFPDDFGQIDIDGVVTNPPDQYQYFSADLFKQQASNPHNKRLAIESAEGDCQLQLGTQNMETSTFNIEPPSETQDDSEGDENHAHMAISQDSQDSGDWSHDNHDSSW